MIRAIEAIKKITLFIKNIYKIHLCQPLKYYTMCITDQLYLKYIFLNLSKVKQSSSCLLEFLEQQKAWTQPLQILVAI